MALVSFIKGYFLINSKDEVKLKLGARYNDLLKNEFTKDFYQVDYLDKFTIPNISLDISVIIITYNRAPYDPCKENGSLNPLVWSIRSILRQKVNVKEIVVVDDCSDDYTEEVIQWFQNKLQNHKITYIKNGARMGSAKSRNIGVDKAECNYVLFMDDDCYLAPYACFGTFYSMQKLEKRGTKIAALVLPIYHRMTVPADIVPRKELGSIYFSLGVENGNWEKYPLSYINPGRSKFIDPELHIMKPFKVSHMPGVALCNKNIYKAVGGFPTNFVWSNKHGEETEFGARINQHGYSIYFTPDPKFQAFHSRHGHEDKIEFKGKDWLEETHEGESFKQIIEDAEKKRRNTGNRVDDDEWMYCKIISFFTIIYKRNHLGGLKFLERMHEHFVEKNDGLIGKATKIEPASKREEIFLKAVEDGMKFILDEEQEKLKSIREFRNSFDQASINK